MKAGDPFFKCAFAECNKRLHKTDNQIRISVLCNDKTQDSERFCCFDHLAEWAKFRANFPMEKKAGKPRLIRLKSAPRPQGGRPPKLSNPDF